MSTAGDELIQMKTTPRKSIGEKELTKMKATPLKMTGERAVAGSLTKMKATPKKTIEGKAVAGSFSRYRPVARSYNRYNLFYILERESLILGKGGTTQFSATLKDGSKSSKPLKGYENLNLPPLPPRFAHLSVPRNWCVAGQQKKRRHRKSHGLASFRELDRTIADNWKAVNEEDKETLEWCIEVEKVLKQACLELMKRLYKEEAAAIGCGLRGGEPKPGRTLPLTRMMHWLRM